MLCRNPCACHANSTLNLKKRPGHLVFSRFWLPNRSRAQALCKFCRLQLPKVLRRRQFLTILTSKSSSRAGVVQILRSSTSKSAPTPPVFNDFDFQIALARRRGANFVDILRSRSSATPVFRTYLCEPSKRQNYGKTQHFAQFLPAKSSCLTSLLYHICVITPLGWQIFSSNSQIPKLPLTIDRWYDFGQPSFVRSAKPLIPGIWRSSTRSSSLPMAGGETSTAGTKNSPTVGPISLDHGMILSKKCQTSICLVSPKTILYQTQPIANSCDNPQQNTRQTTRKTPKKSQARPVPHVASDLDDPSEEYGSPGRTSFRPFQAQFNNGRNSNANIDMPWYRVNKINTWVHFKCWHAVRETMQFGAVLGNKQ